MFMILLALLACEEPDPLPPSVGSDKPRKTRMVSHGSVRGYLVDARKGNNGTLLLVDRIDKNIRNRSKTIADGPVFVIPAVVDMGKARAYFEGLDAVDTVRIVCERKECPKGL